MNQETLMYAINEAERFIDRAHELDDLIRSQDADTWTSLNPKESGAVRRASMDLTRVLADLRQGR